MQIYNKKYLLIGIIASLVTACGGGSGGGDNGGSSNKSPNQNSISNPLITTTDVLLPDKPIVDIKPKEDSTIKIPEFNFSNNNETTEVVPKVDSEVKTEVQPEVTPKVEAEVAPEAEPEIQPDVAPKEEIDIGPPPRDPRIENNSSVINVTKVRSAGMFAYDNETISNEKSGTINILADEAVAMSANGPNSKAINNGNIIAKFDNTNFSTNLMESFNGGTIENNGTIKGTGNIITGMFAESNGEKLEFVNDGAIELTNVKKAGVERNRLIGIDIYKIADENKSSDIAQSIHVVNNGTISIDNNEFEALNPRKLNTTIGMNLVSYIDSGTSSIIENRGTVSITGNSGVGMMVSGKDASALNYGTINIDGEKGIGMYALYDAVAINGVNGVINIKGENSYGMVAANGGRIINNGKIILADEVNLSTAMFANKEGSSIVNKGEIILSTKNSVKRAILATNGATYVNEGKILTDGNVEITTDQLSKFIVGKDAKEKVATVKSKKSLKISGSVVASKDLIDGNKKEIVYSNIFSAPKVELSKPNNTESVSLFYDSKLKINKDGNADMVVFKNKNSIEKNYASKEFNSLINSLDKYLDTENTKLTTDEKIVTNKVLKAKNVKEVKKAVKDLSGQIYTNLPRQIFDIQRRFVKEDEKLIDNLNNYNYNYNFNFFSDKSSVKNKGEISGYKSTSGGFVGTKRFENDTYGFIGFENSGLKYNEGSKGTIQSIHTSIYKKLTLNTFDVKFGLNGEYNIHKTNRTLNEFNKKAKSKYDSYTLGFNGYVSQVYGDTLYIKPMLELNLGYGAHKKFSETNIGELGLTLKDENYFSILPSTGFTIGKDFNFINIYSSIIYSYELGNLNKKQNFSLLKNKVNYKLNGDSLKKENLSLNAGISTEIKDFKVTFEIGKEIGKRDNNYFTLGLGYKF